MNKHYLLLLIPVLLGGCSHQYVEPLTGHNLVFVTIENETNHELVLNYYANPQDCSDSYDVGVIPPKSSLTRTFEGDRHLTFGMQYLSTTIRADGQSSVSCEAISTLYAGEYPRYELHFDKVPEGCLITAFHFEQSVRKIESRFMPRIADPDSHGACQQAPLP